ncbi:hypothetical protein MCOR25_008821 [Pyricularia grisea]|nr:hypothetical protein MCOR25_008821 [Pyricularia grisea]
MKATLSSVLLAALAGSVVAEKINTSQFNAQFLQAYTAPNAVEMSVLREKKVTQHEQDVAAGRFDMAATRPWEPPPASMARRVNISATAWT